LIVSSIYIDTVTLNECWEIVRLISNRVVFADLDCLTCRHVGLRYRANYIALTAETVCLAPSSGLFALLLTA